MSGHGMDPSLSSVVYIALASLIFPPLTVRTTLTLNQFLYPPFKVSIILSVICFWVGSLY